LTLNYLKAMLAQLSDRGGGGGILIHCLSGWDRTPLFVCLIRCVAWAEGLAHASLNAEEMLHLSLSYDWLLFRHRLADRMQRREEVLYFAFYALALVALDDSVRISDECNLEVRREKLLILQAAFVSVWEKVVKR
jgi:myotubularin-related protein 14